MANEYQTPDAESDSSGGGIEITDIYFILFRRKWLVLAGVMLGIVAAVGLWKLRQPMYQSEAKLFVRYVIEMPVVSPAGAEVRVQNPDESGAGVLNSEIEILNSVDLVQHVVKVIGPERILPEGAPTNDVDRAAGIVSRNFKAIPMQRSKILMLKFQHPKSDVTQTVLQGLIDAYLKKHDEIHHALGISDATLTQQREQLRTNLASAEFDFRRMREALGVHSLEDSKKENIKLESSIRQELYSAQADLAQKQAMFDSLRQQSTPSNGTGPSFDLNAVPPSDKIDEHRNLSEQIAMLSRRLLDFGGLTGAAPQVRTNQLMLQEARVRKSVLESNFPSLQRFNSTLPPLAFVPGQPVQPALDVATLGFQVRSLESKMTALTNQLATVRADLKKVDDGEAEMTELQRRIASLQKQLAFVEQSLLQARFNANPGDRQNTSISPAQAPSPPSRDFAQLYKKMVMAVVGGLLLGLIMAFVTEKLLDRSLKRSKDVESLLAAPLFLTIPSMRFRPRLRSGAGAGKSVEPELTVAKRKLGDANGIDVMDIPLQGSEELKPYHDALRDRLVNHFDVRDMTHKPKLIAVTSCGDGAGVSSIATGLAASLSETGDGNVLVVDMRGKRGAAHAFYHGKPAIGLAEALENETRNGAQVQENLYVVSAGAAGSLDQKLQKIVPLQFSRFVPKLKASDYDYIIFDMPPVGQTSVTAKVARYMDMVLMVVESEKTDRDVAKRAGLLLAESNATVATVLNKQKTYVPKWLQQEFQ